MKTKIEDYSSLPIPPNFTDTEEVLVKNGVSYKASGLGSIPIPVPFGGTGDVSFSANSIPYGNGTNPLQSLAGVTRAHRYFLGSAGNGSIANSPVWVPENVFNVQDPMFGAKGDGITDDTAAIQAAINAAKATVNAGLGIGGAVVLIPSGQYVISGTGLLVDAQFISIVGDGPTASEFLVTGSGTSFLKFYGGPVPGNATPMAASVCGFKITYQSGAWTNLLHLVNLSFLDIHTLWIEGDAANVDYCLHGESALSFGVDFCQIRYAKHDCVNLQKLSGAGNAYPNTISLTRCEIARGGDWGIHFQDGEMLRVDKCQVEHNGTVKDINHGGIFIDNTGFEAGIGNVAIIKDTHIEDSTGINVKCGVMGFGANRLVLENVHALGGDTLYGLYGDVTSPTRSRLYARNCSFFNSTSYDYYFANDFLAEVYDCQGFTQSINQKSTAIPYPSNTSFGQINLGFISYIPQEFSAGETAPTVNYLSPVKYFNNGSATIITSFVGCGDGAMILVYSPNTNTTLKNRNSGSPGTTDEIDCPGGVDYKLSANESVFFFRINNHWYPAGFSGTFNAPATFNKDVSIAGNLDIADHIIFTSKTLNLRYDTSTGANDARLCLSPGNADGGVVANGPYLDMRGVTNGVPAQVRLAAGNATGGKIILATGNDVVAATINEDQTIDLSNDLRLASGKVLKVNSTQVIAAQQTGMGATLGAATAGGSYTSAEQTMLQAVYNKMVSLETKLKAHGLIAA